MNWGRGESPQRTWTEAVKEIEGLKWGGAGEKQG